MPEFTYKALLSDGSIIDGAISARDRNEANRKLANIGVQPFEVSDAGAAPSAKSAVGAPPKSIEQRQPKGAESRRRSLFRLTPSQVIFFTEELSDLLAAGVQLEPALKLMEDRDSAGPIRPVTARVREQVRDGVSLSRALAAASSSFSPLYCNLVAAGEVGGALADILKRQIRYLTTLQELRSTVLTAMIYPAFLLASGMAVTALFISFLVPRLTQLIQSSGGEVPAAVALLIGGIAFMKNWWWAVLLGLALVAAGFIGLIRHPKHRLSWERYRLKLPLFGTLELRRFHVQFLETISNLLGNGLPLIRSLQLCEGAAQNLFLQQKLAQVSAQVADGSSLHRSLQKASVFPSTLIDMVRIGEQTGQLTSSLAKAGERLDRDLNRSVERISAFIQPVIIVVMAGVVGTMAYLMVTVIYDTISILRSR